MITLRNDFTLKLAGINVRSVTGDWGQWDREREVTMYNVVREWARTEE